MKRLMKKIYMIGMSTFMAFNFCAPIVQATAPINGGTNPDVGVAASELTVGESSASVTVTLSYNDNLNFNDYNPIQLVNDVTPTKNGVAVYLRIAKVEGENEIRYTPWIKVWDEYSLPGQLERVAVTEAGTYRVFYYVDGKGNYPDVTGQD